MDKDVKSLRDTIDKTIETVWSEICDNYCKYPQIWDAEKEGAELYESEICNACPFNKL